MTTPADRPRMLAEADFTGGAAAIVYEVYVVCTPDPHDPRGYHEIQRCTDYRPMQRPDERWTDVPAIDRATTIVRAARENGRLHRRFQPDNPSYQLRAQAFLLKEVVEVTRHAVPVAPAASVAEGSA